MSDRRVFAMSDEPQTIRAKLIRLLTGEDRKPAVDGGARAEADVIPIHGRAGTGIGGSIKVVKP